MRNRLVILIPLALAVAAFALVPQAMAQTFQLRKVAAWSPAAPQDPIIENTTHAVTQALGSYGFDFRAQSLLQGIERFTAAVIVPPLHLERAATYRDQGDDMLAGEWSGGPGGSMVEFRDSPYDASTPSAFRRSLFAAAPISSAFYPASSLSESRLCCSGHRNSRCLSRTQRVQSWRSTEKPCALPLLIGM